MKTTVTKKELALFHINAHNYAMMNPDKKFSKYLNKVAKANQEPYEKYQEDAEGIVIDLASVDEKQNLVYEDAARRIYAMTKEAKRQEMAKTKELNLSKVEITFKHAPLDVIPKDLDPQLKKMFTPFVIAPEPEEELE